MSKINVLSFEIANLIAAGEVVERPASVLKELIENSIDSGADTIVAEIKHGGVAMIRVTDNGSGMSKEDLPVSIKRHATSKIQTKDDLASIMTLGFRGEALAAISSVSSLTIISKTRDSETATMLQAEAGNIVDISDVYAADGTTVVVSNLFYNVPARRKFLKKDATEAMNVSVLVEKVALSRPDISIQLLIDGEEKFKTPGDGELLSTIYAIFGKAFSSKLIEVDAEAEGIKVKGYIGRSDNVKKNRNLMNVFINGRYVKSLTAQAAIERAYTSYIAPEAFPTCVLFIDMSASMVDVNVHPAKLEVKFADERSVFEIVYYSVKSALEKHEYRPEIELAKNNPPKNVLGAYVAIGEDTKGEQLKMNVPSYIRTSVPEGKDRSAGYHSPAPRYEKAPSYQERHDSYSQEKPLHVSSVSSGYGDKLTEGSAMTPSDSVELLKRYRDSINDSVNADNTPLQLATEGTPKDRNYKLIGEAFNCYVIIERDKELLLIDKHAAHERVIFEELKKQINEDKRISSQLLMLPLTVILGGEEIAVAEEYKEEIKALGFDYSLSSGSLDILSVPQSIDIDKAETLLINMLDEIIDGKGKPSVTDAIRRERALYQIACKAAIKGGRVYTEEVIYWLVDTLMELPDITVCPHGRPVAYKLTKNELDRQFERLK